MAEEDNTPSEQNPDSNQEEDLELEQSKTPDSQPDDTPAEQSSKEPAGQTEQDDQEKSTEDSSPSPEESDDTPNKETSQSDSEPADTKDDDQTFSEDRVLAGISYISVLFVIPLLIRKDDPFVKSHIKQGIILFAAEVVAWVVLWFLTSMILVFMGFTGITITNLLVSLSWIVFVVIAILGIYQALNGRKWEIPFIGRFKKYLDF